MKIQPIVQSGQASRAVLILYLAITLLYFSWWFWPGNMENRYLYGLLFFGEIYHIVMAVGFIYTVWPRNNSPISNHHSPITKHQPSVAVFITVAGEPVELVEQTIKAAKNINYENKKIYILNDGFAAKKKNWQEIEFIAKRMGVKCITRKFKSGAKAGNINNGLKLTRSDLITVFDADMAPHRNFLTKLVPFFSDGKIAFVQSPQFYKNAKVNKITAGAWEQQNFFFGPIMNGKNNLSSAFICGTNVVIRRKALEEVGGMFEKNIAEDFLTSLFIHQKKWKSIYIPEVLSEGLAPVDLLSYYNQQHRWARGSLEVLFNFNPLFSRRLTFGQRIQYLLSALFYLNGLIVLIDIVMPVLFLFFGLQPVAATTTSFAIYFFPYMFMCLYTLFITSGESLTFRAISFSQSSFMLQLSALISVFLRSKTKFSVTAKEARTGNFLPLIYPHLLYSALAITSIIFAVIKHGPTPAVVTNAAWVLFNITMFLPFISVGFHWENFMTNFYNFNSEFRVQNSK